MNILTLEQIKNIESELNSTTFSTELEIRLGKIVSDLIINLRQSRAMQAELETDVEILNRKISEDEGWG